MKFHAIKTRRISEGGDWYCRTDPESFDGGAELVEELCSYLLERPLKEDPVQMAARKVQDDLAIMFEKENEQYYLLAGAVLLARLWRLKEKWRMPVSEIHTSVDVPPLRLEKGMEFL